MAKKKRHIDGPAAEYWQSPHAQNTSLQYNASPPPAPSEKRKQITDEMTYINANMEDKANASADNYTKMLAGPGGYMDTERERLMQGLNKLPNRGLKKNK